MPTNQSLKALRDRRHVTVRQVEFETRKIAEAKGDKRFYISNARLTQLENDSSSEPSLWKLFSLSAIYNVRIIDLMKLYNVDTDETDKLRAIASPGVTRPLEHVPAAYQKTDFLRTLIKSPDQTTLLPRVPPTPDDKFEVVIGYPDRQFTGYGYIGLDDRTMYPLIRPGSFVWLDTRRRKINGTAGRSGYDRPIYFIELRNGYACAWCELQGNQLLLIPHHSSPVSIRRFTYPNEAEIVGRVVRFSTSCVDD